NNGEGAAFSFAPKAKTEVTFDQGNLEVIAEASVTLNGTVPKDETAEYGYYPEASADLNMRLKDGIQIYPEDTALYGMRATVELVGEVTVSRMVIVNGSETTQAQSAVDFAVQTPPGIDNFEGALSEYREDGESEIQTDGPTNLSTPTTITLFREQAVLGPPPLDEFSSQFNNFDVDVAASARVWTSGPSGATFRAEVTMQVNNIRVNRVTLEEGGTEIALSQLKSISRSGYDWIGNGEPELQLDAFSWDNVAGGSFGEDTNWDVDAVPGSGDLAKFELPGSYTVDVGTQEVEQLRIGGDPSFNVSFNNAALTVNSTSLTPPGTIINNGIFTLSSGTVSTTHATFGSATATTVRMTGTDTTWNNTGRLNVGPIGETVFEINDGAHVTSGETFINLVDRGSISLSSISVSEFGSRWATGNS
ncbi:MAG: hypothetical protein KJT03_23400, partial [Verrucomicrobiae bacterium]|nr:hypothetical protein [Verrucomicrobiae bacterium]